MWFIDFNHDEGKYIEETRRTSIKVLAARAISVSQQQGAVVIGNFGGLSRCVPAVNPRQLNILSSGLNRSRTNQVTVNESPTRNTSPAVGSVMGGDQTSRLTIGRSRR